MKVPYSTVGPYGVRDVWVLRAIKLKYENTLTTMWSSEGHVGGVTEGMKRPHGMNQCRPVPRDAGCITCAIIATSGKFIRSIIGVQVNGDSIGM